MLGSFQRARQLLQDEVVRLREAHEELERKASDSTSSLQRELRQAKAECRSVREELERLQRQLAKHVESSSRDSKDIASLAGRLAVVRKDEGLARQETLKQAQRAAEEVRLADVQEEDLAQLLRTEAALEGMLMVQWEMLEDLAQQVNLDPPWRCGLCSCRNPQREVECSVCESPKDGKTEMGSKTVEAYFEFRLHQEFLGRDPLPPPERCLPALQIALHHRREKWIEQEEITELQHQCRDIATQPTLDPVLRAEAAFTLFQLGDEEGQRMGRMLLKTMGENTDAVRRMCRKQRQARVATLYQQLLLMKQKDMKRFREWQGKMEQAQLRYRQRLAKQNERRLASKSSLGSCAGRNDEDLELQDLEEDDLDFGG